MNMAFAPQRVQSLPKGSICQTYDIERSLSEALRRQANLKAQVARMKIRDQPGHLQATMLSEKLYLEEEVHEIAYIIDQLRLDMNKVKVDDKSNGPLQRSRSFCQTTQECQSAENNLEQAILGTATEQQLHAITAQGKTRKQTLTAPGLTLDELIQAADRPIVLRQPKENESDTINILGI